MSDPIRDLDDVEAQAWATIYAAWSTFAHESAEGHADDGVRLLRERRLQPAERAVSLATRLVSAEGRAVVAAAVERSKVVAWVRAESVRLDGEADARASDSLYAKAERSCAFLLRSVAISIERGEHDR